MTKMEKVIKLEKLHKDIEKLNKQIASKTEQAKKKYREVCKLLNLP